MLMKTPQKIAVIGAGISGLTAAYRLGERHDVTLFEANAWAGGHTNTVDVMVDGEKHAIDTGFIVFNERTYPNFIRLLNELGVASRPTEMSFSVRCEDTGLEYCGSTLNGLFAQRRNLLRPSFYRMIRDILRFGREATSIAEGNDSELSSGAGSAAVATVGEFLHRRRYSSEFCRNYLLPMGAAIWSCPTGKFADFPIQFIAEFYHNHGLLQIRNRPRWRVIDGGSRTYVDALLMRYRGRLHLNAPVRSVRRTAGYVELETRDRAPERFDHVVFACHSDQALRMLKDSTDTEREILSAFPYEKNLAVLHTDTAMLPRRRRAWASWNYLIEEPPASSSLAKVPSPKLTSDTDVSDKISETAEALTGVSGSIAASVTYCMNILQHLKASQTFCVTLNAKHRIDPRRILGEFQYEHPVFTRKRSSFQARHAELIGVNRTSYCGAYWRNGFHEDGVVSAMAVCGKLLEDLDTGTSGNESSVDTPQSHRKCSVPFRPEGDPT